MELIEERNRKNHDFDFVFQIQRDCKFASFPQLTYHRNRSAHQRHNTFRNCRASGKDAVELIEERNRKNHDFDFVLVDWRMPDMDGMETILEIRRRVVKRIPLFLISAYDWSDIERDADECSFVTVHYRHTDIHQDRRIIPRI